MHAHSKQLVIQTFDDGPDISLTPRLLDTLAAENLKAVFFVVGEKVTTPESKRIVERAFNEGHRIGNHSFSHPDLSAQNAREIRSQLLKTEDLIGEFLIPPKLFRPPFGIHNSIVDEVVSELGYELMLWNVDPEDWNPLNQPTKWIDLALTGLRSQTRSILLCHDTLQSTVDNYPLLIDRAKQSGCIE